jgi:1,4-dihydroxy-6-naphthoate synthase
MKKLTLGFSPCPNDCFIFDAMVHQRIDLAGLEFEWVMADVEELNRRAFAGSIDITKLSYHAFAHLTEHYVLLDAGSALGFGVGPILIQKSEVRSKKAEVAKPVEAMTIAIPGKYTTANFLFSLAFPGAKNKEEMLFSAIEEAVLSGRVDAGLIIHENRFTYGQRGLEKIIDLGEWWERETGSAIPLGGIVASRAIPEEVKHQVNALVRQSVQYAFANPEASRTFVKQHAQEMSEEVMQKHIGLYVNNYSIDLGPEGKKAVRTLFERAVKNNVVQNIRTDYFLNP